MKDTAKPSGPVPLTLLTGFLGAGKTSVLNRILAGDHGLRIAVLVNDFGDLDIAEELVDGRSDGTLRLTNGCICCSLKEGLVEAVSALLHRDPRPEHIVLEASGVADPTGIATTLLAPVFRGRISLDAVACIVDAREFCAEHAEHDLILRQLMVSDLILLNKIDTVDEQAAARAESLIRGWLAQARILRCRHGEVPLQVLLSTARVHAPGDLDEHSCAGADCNHPAHQHAQRFGTLLFRTSRALDEQALRAFARELPGSVYRMKGVIRLGPRDSDWRLVQGVGRRLELLPTVAQSSLAESRLLLIGRAGGFAAAELERALQSCVQDQPVGTDLH